MSANAAVIIGTLLISAAVSYAWWTNLRMMRLREDLYDRRDWLFDQALELGALSDPGYRATRERLNTILKHAHFINFPVLVHAVFAFEPKHPPKIQSEDPRMQVLIDQVFRWYAHRVMDYLLYETASGWALQFIFGLWWFSATASEPWRKAERRIELLVRSGLPLDTLEPATA